MVPESPYPPEITGDDALVTVARAMRTYHDAVGASGSIDEATRLGDLAGVAWRWVPLIPDWDAQRSGFDWAPHRRGTRLRLLCDEYGLTREERVQLLGHVERRIESALMTAASDREREDLLRSAWHVPELRDAWEPYLS